MKTLDLSRIAAARGGGLISMLRAAWKNLLARKLRLLMSGFAIVIGVAFVAGSFIFTDTLNKSFDSIFAGSVGDVVVQPAGASGRRADETNTLTLPASVVETRSRRADGAARADGNISAFGVFVVGEDGKVVGAQGAPGLGLNYNDAPSRARPRRPHCQPTAVRPNAPVR